MTDQRTRAQKHLVPHFTKATAWKSKNLAIIERGEGCYVWDTDDNKYLDGLSGLFCTNLGHARSDLSAAAAKQMDQLAYFPNWGFASPPTIEAASMIAELAPGDLNEVFFVSSGSEAVESALKLARSYHLARGENDRYKVIAREWAYHGTTLGALAVTGISMFRDPFLPMLWDGVSHVPNTYGEEIPDGGTAADLACVRAIEAKILEEGPETVAMVIAEPVQNGRGAVVPPQGYWQELRKICDKYGVLLCADEVITAFGRLGHWTGSDRFGVVPDMITFAKGVTSAYQPLGGVIVRQPVIDTIWDSPMASFVHGSTYGGHPVATAVAVANMRALKDEQVLENVLANEGRLRSGLAELSTSRNCVKEVRGTGYFYAVELMADHARGLDLSDDQTIALQGGVLAGLTHDAKVLIRPDNRGATMLMIAPPLVADIRILDDLLSRVDQVLDMTDKWLVSNP